MKWQFLNTGPASGAHNMLLDEELAHDVAIDRCPPTVRVYGWNPPAISLGWNQSEDQIDREAACRAGIDVVRRPTGGRAILHSDEVTYSVIQPAEGRSIADVYRLIGTALLAALENLGINASLEKSQPHFSSLYRTAQSAICFASSARHEVKVEGRKLIGSAQRRYSFKGREVVLQHGSIPLGADHLRIVDFLLLPPQNDRRQLRDELAALTTDLTALLGHRPTFTSVAEAVRSGFERAWSISLKPAHSTLSLQALAR